MLKILNRSKYLMVSLFLLLPFLFVGIIPKYTLEKIIPGCTKLGQDGRILEYVKATGETVPKIRVKHCLLSGTKSFTSEIKGGTNSKNFSTTQKIASQAADARLKVTLAERPVPKSQEPQTNRYLEHLAKRYNYNVALYALFISTTTALFYILVLILRVPNISDRVFLFCGSLVVILGAFYFFGFRYESIFWNDGIARIITGDVITEVSKAIVFLSDHQGAGFVEFDKSFFALHIQMFDAFIASFVIIAAGLAALTMIDINADGEKLLNNRKMLDMFLTFTAIHFAVFVFYIRQYIQIGYPFVENVQDARVLGNALIQYWAASSSLLLIVLFGLAFSAHHYRANLLSKTESIISDSEKEALKNAMSEKAPFDRMIDFLKVLLPLISGVAFEFSSFIGL